MALEPNEELRHLAANYTAVLAPVEFGQRIVEGHYVKVDENRAAAIAAAYEVLPAFDQRLVTVDAYEALVDELSWQWTFLEENGYQLTPWTKEGQPYANSQEMRDEVRNAKALFYFTGGEPHPFLSEVHPETGVIGNEMLRAVHDIFGHAAEGYGFGPRGEENAWIHHSMMFSPLAQHALTTETRGQNSWVNFGPHKELPVTERPYADQKVALLPDWCCDWKEALNEKEQGGETPH